jgi:hypothetical protein
MLPGAILFLNIAVQEVMTKIVEQRRLRRLLRDGSCGTVMVQLAASHHELATWLSYGKRELLRTDRERRSTLRAVAQRLEELAAVKDCSRMGRWLKQISRISAVVGMDIEVRSPAADNVRSLRSCIESLLQIIDEEHGEST